jgi:hypothetical protein
MNSDERRKLGTGKSSHDFAIAHPFTDPGQIALVDGLGADLTRARAMVTQQRSGLLDVRAATAHRKELRQELQVPLRQLVTIAHAAADVVPDFSRRFVLPARGISHQAFLTATRAMVAEALVHQSVFVDRGMAPTLLEDLTKTLDEYEKTIEQRNAGRRAHVGARSDLNAVLSSVMARIAQLDAIYSYRYRRQPEQLAAWKSARDIPWPKNGSANGNGTPPASGSTGEEK